MNKMPQIPKPTEVNEPRIKAGKRSLAHDLRWYQEQLHIPKEDLSLRLRNPGIPHNTPTTHEDSPGCENNEQKA